MFVEQSRLTIRSIWVVRYKFLLDRSSAPFYMPSGYGTCGKSVYIFSDVEFWEDMLEQT